MKWNSAKNKTVTICEEFKCEDLTVEEGNGGVKKRDDELVKILGKIGSENLEVVVDTASQITFISRNKYEDLIAKSPESIVGDLPIKSMRIVGVTGVNAKKIRRQVLIKMNIGDYDIEVMFLVIGGVYVDVLLGVDFLRQKRSTIDFGGGVVRFLDDSRQIEAKMVASRSGVKSSCVCLELENSNFEWNEKLQDVRRLVEENISDKNNVENLVGIFEEYRDIFTQSPGKIRNLQYRIKVKENLNLKSKSYPIPHSKEKLVQEKLQEMLDEGIIEESRSPFSNPLIIVSKEDGSTSLYVER